MEDKKYEAVLVKLVYNSIKESKLSKQKIKADLASRNIPEDKIDELYKLGFEQYEKNNTQMKFLFLGLSILLFCALFFLIPISFNGMAAGILFLLGAGLISYFLSMTIPRFFKRKDEKPEKYHSQWRGKYSTFFIVGAIILGGSLFINHGMKVSRSIDSDGIQVVGIIIDGSSLRVKRSTTYKLQVNFQTLEKQEIKTSIDVSERIFNNSAKNQRILLEYSKSNPKLVRIAQRAND